MLAALTGLLPQPRLSSLPSLSSTVCSQFLSCPSSRLFPALRALTLAVLMVLSGFVGIIFETTRKKQMLTTLTAASHTTKVLPEPAKPTLPSEL